MAEKPGFLPNLTDGFIELYKKESITTLQFAEACANVLPIFDHIGNKTTLHLCHTIRSLSNKRLPR